MAKQIKTQKPTVEENVNQEEVILKDTVEGVVEEEVKESVDNTIEDNTPEVKEDNNSTSIPEKENTIEEKNTNKVVRIIQRRPSHYSLLMEDGRQLVVHKSLFNKNTMTVKGDK